MLLVGTLLSDTNYTIRVRKRPKKQPLSITSIYYSVSCFGFACILA